MRDCWSFKILRSGVENIGEEEEERVDRSCWIGIFIKFFTLQILLKNIHFFKRMCKFCVKAGCS